jgi:hypothetical protein
VAPYGFSMLQQVYESTCVPNWTLGSILRHKDTCLPSSEIVKTSFVTRPTIMHSFVQLLVVGIAITGAFAQYNDGYETVNLPTDPVQIRLAYQGPTAMMGKHLGVTRNIY